MDVSDLINAASAKKVSEGFRLLKSNNLPGSCLLQNGNPFNDINLSPGDVIKNRKDTLKPSEVKEFMAVSTLIHCMDGWTYLNNSVHAFLNGDLPIAIHLAYYAELRAAISFLASEGILVANSQQICLKDNDELYIPGINPLKKLKDPGTHSATWKIMEGLLNDHHRSINALAYFSYKGKTFKELTQYIPKSPSKIEVQSLIARKWLKTWSLDIEKYTQDRTMRNYSSYNPNIRRNFTPISPGERLKNINDFWKVLDPSIYAFSNIDQYLFSAYLNKIYDEYKSSFQNGDPMDKSAYIDLFFKNAGLTNDSNLTVIFKEDRPNMLIKHASDDSKDKITGNVKPLSIIARSILLLRYATGACAYLLKSNNIERSDLNFYFDEIGRDSGMWDSPRPEDFKSLWDDVFLLSEYFDEYLDENPDPSIFNIRNELGEFVNYSPIYTQFSRASLWGLGL